MTWDFTQNYLNLLRNSCPYLELLRNREGGGVLRITQDYLGYLDKLDHLDHLDYLDMIEKLEKLLRLLRLHRSLINTILRPTPKGPIYGSFWCLLRALLRNLEVGGLLRITQDYLGSLRNLLRTTQEFMSLLRITQKLGDGGCSWDFTTFFPLFPKQ